MPAQGTALLYRLPSDRGDGGPHSVEHGVAPSSFGMSATTLGPSYGAASIIGTMRRAELEFRERYYTCRQHDHKTYNFSGSVIPSGRQSMVQPLMSSNAARPAYFVPMSSRRPSNPYRMGRKVVGSFTNMLLSHGRWPQMRSADHDTQDFAEAVVAACSMVVEMIRARNAGGSCGVVGLSWGWFEGRPRVKTHEGRNLHCLEWADENELVPAHVTELWTFKKQVPNPKTGKPELKPFYHRLDWTVEADIVFKDVPVPERLGDEPEWELFIDHQATVVHRHGRIHFEWIANLPDDATDSQDGQPDYAETYEQMDTLDIVNSVVVRGAILNLDPTLVLAVDPDTVGNVVKKGSEDALTVGIGGQASYLELAGTSIDGGLKLFNEIKGQILETCECVLNDPDKAAAAGMSSVALKVIYAPMIAKCDVLRMTYGRAIERVVNGLIDFARQHLLGEAVLDETELAPPTEVPDPFAEPVLDESGNPMPANDTPAPTVQFYVDLPSREETEPVMGPDGLPTDQQQVVSRERRPGQGTITLEWGEYFKPTADDNQKTSAAVGQAVAGKAIMSQRAAVELIANLYNLDPNREWIEVSKENEIAAKQAASANQGMFPPTGGAAGDPNAPEPPVAPPVDAPSGQDEDIPV